MQLSLNLSDDDQAKSTYPVLTITASRRGLTGAQKKRLASLIRRIRPEEVLHGDCVGGDADCHRIVTACSRALVGVYPSDRSGQRAFCGGVEVKAVPRPPLERNRTMVRRSSLVVAFPASFSEELRSGTWATVRHARRVGRPVVLIWPDGRFGKINFKERRNDETL